jgi:DNA invertase Pin-like site-specific DNA recombinase
MICGYIRPVLIDNNYDTNAQMQAVEQYAAAHGLSLAGCYSDEPDTAGTRLHLRPGGGKLGSRLERGDQVIFARVGVVFRNLPDLETLVDWWLARGITLHFAGDGIRLEPDTESSKHFLASVALCIRFGHERLSESCRQARARSMAAGTKFNAVAVYGTRWQGKGKRARLVEDTAEIAVMEQIDQWKGAGLSYYHCWQRLLYAKQKTKAGREWSLERVKRIHKRYLAYKAKLAESGAEPTG